MARAERRGQRSVRSGGDVRLFVGVYPPPDVAATMLDLLDGRPLPEHRRTAAGQAHVTALFIGPRPRAELAAVSETVARCCSGVGPFTLRVERLITLPERGAPRLIAAETGAPGGLLEIHRRLAHRLTTGGKRRSERFRPHVTMCRFRPGARAERLDEAIDGPSFEVREVRLMKSVLHPSGAEHREVLAAPLDGRT